MTHRDDHTAEGARNGSNSSSSRRQDVDGGRAAFAVRGVAPGGWADVPAAEGLLAATMAGRWQRRLGETHDVLALPGFGPWAGDRLVGLVTWSPGRPRAELAALAVAAGHRGRGIGATLVEAVVPAARDHGADVLWLVTTNDNLDALRLYQRHGFRLAELHAGAVDESRRHKPAIPTVGDHGIPLHDELVLERRL